MKERQELTKERQALTDDRESLTKERQALIALTGQVSDDKVKTRDTRTCYFWNTARFALYARVRITFALHRSIVRIELSSVNVHSFIGALCAVCAVCAVRCALCALSAVRCVRCALCALSAVL